MNIRNNKPYVKNILNNQLLKQTLSNQIKFESLDDFKIDT